MRQGWPMATRGMVVGLLGGSFDPAHGGHVHITREALKRFGLDRVWWLVSPGNPLKPRPPAPLAVRVAEARRLMRHPKVAITDLEARTGTRATHDTLEALRRHYPGVRFVWLMGADNLAQFHRWGRWRDILHMVPVGVLARPGAGEERLSPAARAFARARLPEGAAVTLGLRAPPAWCFVNLPMVDLSSSAIRASGAWRSGGQPRRGAEVEGAKPGAPAGEADRQV
jgi:nicotinate-nucleotide adenylyltransferase